MILSLLEQALVALPLLIGGYITLCLLKVPDFSLESAYLMGAVMAYVASDLPLPIVVISASLGGIAVGMTVTAIHHYFKLPFLLAAIITNGLCHGVTQGILGTSMKSFHLTLPFSELGCLICVGIVLSTLIGLGLRSQLGYSLAIYGHNPAFFQHHATSGRFVLGVGMMTGHACAGMAGFLFALSNGFVDLTMNFGIILLCLTALILGKSLIQTHRPNIAVPLVGLVVYFCVQQSLLHIGLNLKYFNAFQAACILVTLGVLQRHQKIPLGQVGV